MGSLKREARTSGFSKLASWIAAVADDIFGLKPGAFENHKPAELWERMALHDTLQKNLEESRFLKVR